ncbi:MAG TPA: hypothetical protein VGI47_08690 [Candidatus Binataceae bacterium]|jgi:hypothetical protein
MADDLSGISEAIQKSGEAFAKAISEVGKALQDAANLPGSSDRDRLFENWLRVARLSKDGVITAIEQGFALWERQIRQLAALGPKAEARPSNPMDAWTENWRTAIEAFTSGGNFSDEVRRQAEAVQQTFADGIRAWQRLWEPDRK